MSDTATVLTAYLWGSPAIELGNREWRKKILPVGDVEYSGRMLHFTRSYLADLVSAFNNRAYDQVSFQLADAKNAHTNDPERHRGTITGLELADDGLYATAQVTEAGERILAENPQLGVSARIVEQYSRSDGKYFPAAIQHVLGTLDPRIPALGQWEPISLSNSGGLVIDLTGHSWANEPGAPLPGDWDLSDQELGELIEVMAEADAEEAGGYELPPQFADFDAQFTENYREQAARDQAQAQARAAADSYDLAHPARTDEDIVSRALSRAAQGIYDTSHAALGFSNQDRAIELTVATGEGLCGSPDPFGRCSARFHDSRCIHAIGVDWQASGPPRSTYETALSNFASGHDLGQVPASYGDGEDSYPVPARTLELAHQLNASWGLNGDTGFDDVFSQSYSGDPYAAMATEVMRPDLAGLQPQRPDHPDVSGIRARLGI